MGGGGGPLLAGADAPHHHALRAVWDAPPGLASGTVRLLRHPSEGDAFQPGEVLVAPMTSPDWMPLLRRAAAVLMFTHTLALELAPHAVRVNAVLPGAVRTEGTTRPIAGIGNTARETEDFLDTFARTRVPLGRVGTPDDIATAVVFLSSDAARYVTGAHLVVDGGTLLT